MKSKKTLLCMIFIIGLVAPTIFGATITVDVNNPNLNTIQKCATLAKTGDIVEVPAGTYPEHVVTKADGVTYKAVGTVTMQGFDINNASTTIDGFDITGYSQQYYGLITILSGGSYSQILNNTVHDGGLSIYGIIFYSANPGAQHCVVRGNVISSLHYVFLLTRGGYHLIENNVFEYLNNRDFVYLFGHDMTFRFNIFRYGNTTSIPGHTVIGGGNHPDIFQTFAENKEPSYNMLFEQNWFDGIEAAFGQLNCGGAITYPQLFPDIHDYVFRSNVFSKIGGNLSAGIPGLKFDHNTFYKVAYNQSGITAAGTLTRADSSRMTLTNNLFVNGGLPPVSDYNGSFFNQGAQLTAEVLGIYVTNEKQPDANFHRPIADAIMYDLAANKYIDSNGFIKPKTKALTNISQFVVEPATSPANQFHDGVYEWLMKSSALNDLILSTYFHDYNLLYPARRNFTDVNGLNGVDPQFINAEAPLASDGNPFSVKNGLKPKPGSPACGAGTDGTDLGAFSCDPSKIYAISSDAVLFPPVIKVVPPPTSDPATPSSGNTAAVTRGFGSFENIFHPHTTKVLGIHIVGVVGDSYKVLLVNRKGEIVRNLGEGTLSSSSLTLPWDGTNDQGVLVGSGVYQLSLWVGDVTAKQKIVVVK